MRTPRGTGSRPPGHSRSRGAHAQTTIPALGLDRPSSDQLKVGRISLTAVFHPNPKKQVWRRQTVDASSAGLFTLIIVSVRALSVTAPGTARSVIAPGPTDPTAYTRAQQLVRLIAEERRVLPRVRAGTSQESAAKIRARDAFVTQQLGACASHDDATQVHHVGAIGEPQRAEGVLLDEQHRDALSLQLGQRVEDALHDHRREPERRFIEQQQARLSQKRARDREHLLFPAGKTSREERAALAQDRKALVCRRDLGAVAAAESHEQVLFDPHSREDLAALGHLDDARANDRVRRRAADFAAVEADTTICRHEAADRGERARLPRPVRADERGHLAGIREERHAVHRLDRAVTNAELLDLEERRIHAAYSLPRYASRTAGLAWISGGVPSAILRPKFSTATRSHVPITRRTSCSMSTMVSPSATSARISSRRRADSAGFIPAAGSSRMRRRGSDASARAISRRRWSP